MMSAMPKPEPAVLPVPPSGKLCFIPLDQLVPTPENPRKFNCKSPFPELVASIRQDGVLVPLIARPMKQAFPNSTEYNGYSKDHRGQSIDKLYDLRAGFRRLKAAKEVGLTTVPVYVRDMTDIEALRITIKENLDREDLLPLEEATAVASYLDRGLTYQQIGTEFGRTAAWVARRAQLAELTDQWRKILTDNGDYADHWARRWPIASLEQVAALPHDQQDKILPLFDGCSHHSRDLQEGKPATVLAFIADEFTHALKNAPWELSDATLCPKAGACTACTSRSGANPLLWEGLENTKDIKPGDRCLMPNCWKEKLKAQTQKDLTALKAKHPDLAVIDNAAYSNTPHTVRNIAKKLKLPTHADYQVKPCKKGDKGAVPVVKLTAHGVGNAINYVKPYKARAPGTYSGVGAEKESQKTVAELREELVERRRSYALAEWNDLVSEHLDDIADRCPVSTAQLLRAIYTFGTDTEKARDSLEAWLTGAKEIEDMLHIEVLNAITSFPLNSSETLPRCMELVGELEKSFLKDAKIPTIADLLAKATVEIPEPTGWVEREKAEKNPTPKAARAGRNPSKKN